MNKIAVIGGGASGMAAAIAAAERGAEVVILEKNPRVGKKILSTGNGRCNFTNINACAQNYNSDFVTKALGEFSPKYTIDFFERLGILAKIEAEGRVYPNSGQASAVLDMLRNAVERLNIRIVTEFDVDSVVKDGNTFKIISKNGKYSADKVIIATGGMAAPKSGSCGDGYRILKNLGHSVTELIPSLAPLKTDRGIQGVRQRGKVTLENGETRIGEIQFNRSSLSGIPVFGLSGRAKIGESVFVDLLPDYTLVQTVEILKKRPSQTMESYLVGILNKALGQMLLKECNIGTLSRRSETLKDEEILKIAEKIKNWRFKIIGFSEWDNAQVTAGGISLNEVNPRTMESKIVPGLYITGELLDIDGDCGGYNLQWAWSSGFAAGGDAAGVQN